MRIPSLAVGRWRPNDFAGEEAEVDRGSWDGDDLPTREGFTSAVEWLYRQVDLPSFPETAWVEVETDEEVMRCEVHDAVGEPERIAAALCAYVVTVGQGLA